MIIKAQTKTRRVKAYPPCFRIHLSIHKRIFGFLGFLGWYVKFSIFFFYKKVYIQTHKSQKPKNETFHRVCLYGFEIYFLLFFLPSRSISTTTKAAVANTANARYVLPSPVMGNPAHEQHIFSNIFIFIPSYDPHFLVIDTVYHISHPLSTFQFQRGVCVATVYFRVLSTNEGYTLLAVLIRALFPCIERPTKAQFGAGITVY